MTIPTSTFTDPDLMNSKETAALLRISMPTLERLRTQGGGPAFIKLGAGKRARVVYRRSDVEAWLASHRFETTAAYAAK